MYKVEVDKIKKLIRLEISGFIKLDEINSLDCELQKVLKQFKSKEPLMLINAIGFKPTTPDIQPVMQKLQIACAEYCRKTSAVYDNIISQMQAKRLGDQTNVNDTFARFSTEDEAMKYLFE